MWDLVGNPGPVSHNEAHIITIKISFQTDKLEQTVWTHIKLLLIYCSKAAQGLYWLPLSFGDITLSLLSLIVIKAIFVSIFVSF